MKASNCLGMLGLLATTATLLIACSTPSTSPANDSLAAEADQAIPPAGIPRKYVAPRGFNGDEFGTTLAQLKARHPRLRELGEPIAIEWRGHTPNVDFSGCLDFGANGGCRNPIISSDVGAGGTAVLAEYYVSAPYEGYTDGYRFDDTGGVLAPVFIDVCAEYAGQGVGAIPNTLPNDARVCAFRAFHHTYLDEYAKNTATQSESDDSVPMYRRVFFGLVNVYGYRVHYRPIGKLVIEFPDGTRLTSVSAPRYVDYHWGQGSPVTVDYAFNPKDGTGVVMIADSPARDYAQKRHDMGDVNFILWRLRQPGGMNHRALEMRYQHGSLGTIDLDDRPGSSHLSARVRALFAPGLP